MRHDQLRKKILGLVKEFYSERPRSVFSPGETYVNYAGRVYDEEELVALVDSSLDFWLTAGRFAQRFESEFSQYLGLKWTYLVNSGSSANLLAISALTSPLLKDRRLKPGDEVITTACGFPTTLNPILQNGLKPVIVDVDLGTYAASVKAIKKALSRKTRAIFLAHTLGNPFNLGEVKKLADKHGLFLVEDNCDALGSTYNGRTTGTFGAISTYSFYPAHHMTMGEGGAVATDDPVLRRALLSLRDWGRDCWCPPGHDNTCRARFTRKYGDLPLGYDHKYVYSHVGYNLKVTDMQAAIGCAQLKKLPGFIKARKENFTHLTKMLEPYSNHLLLPRATPGADPSWFGFPILVKKNAPFKRLDLVRYLEDHRVATRMLFGGNLLRQPAYQGVSMRVVGGLKNADRVMNDLFWIGVYPGIDEKRRQYVAETFSAFFKTYSSQ